MDVEMTTQAEMTFKCTSRSSKVAPFKSQCMISYQLSIVTFAVSHTVYEKFDVKQSNDLEICPSSLTVVSPKSCGVAMCVKCSEESEQMKRKLPFSTTLLSFDAPSPAKPREYLHKPYNARNYVPWATFLLCDALRCTVFMIVILSVRLSVCLSHSWTVSTRFDLRS